MVIEDVYFCAVHEPYTSGEHPVPINTTVVHARSLLHPAVPQPAGGLMYRCLVEFPGRRAGCVVPLATLTFELDGGRLWSEIGDWESVVRSVVELGRRRGCDALVLGLPARRVTLLVDGPDTTVTFHDQFGGGRQAGQRERKDVIDEITGHVRDFIADGGPFWPGDGLVTPPARPHVMPYQPLRSIAVSVSPTRSQSDAALARSQRRLGLRKLDFQSNVAKDDDLASDPWLEVLADHREVVICDTCNTDYTDSTESGGLITESRGYAFCPRCVREGRVETAPTGLLCPPHLSFYEFIKRNR